MLALGRWPELLVSGGFALERLTGGSEELVLFPSNHSMRDSSHWLLLMHQTQFLVWWIQLTL